MDAGGTFTDAVVLDSQGGVEVIKTPTTPEAPEDGVLGAVGPHGQATVVHGTTLTLNRLLQGNLAPVALITHRGTADVPAIGRQSRLDIYDLQPGPQPSLPPARLRFEVPGRRLADGRVAEPYDRKATLAAGTKAVERGATALCVCLLHATRHPEDERRLARWLAPLGLPVHTSAATSPGTVGEVERWSSCLAEAGLANELGGYTERLESRLEDLWLMQSAGGICRPAAAVARPLSTLLSGPAGGVEGACAVAASNGIDRILAFDMGGTSTDVCACEGTPRPVADRTSVTTLAGREWTVPSMEISSIGCGGGSIARVDSGGLLRVGPASAGADPGPAAYGLGDQPTVTDAHVQLGRVAQGVFAGGLSLDPSRVEASLAPAARKLGISMDLAAAGILAVAEAGMEGALRSATTAKGRDSRDFTLVAYGGAGPLHAVGLARRLGIRRVLVPTDPGVLSARGMAEADGLAEQEALIEEPLGGSGSRRWAKLIRTLETGAIRSLADQGHARRNIRTRTWIRLRYAGQSDFLEIPAAASLRAAFETRHLAAYGWILPAAVIECTGLVSRARAPQRALGRGTRPAPTARRSPAAAHHRPCAFLDLVGRSRRVRTSVHQRRDLVPGDRITGPALVEEYSATTVLDPGASAIVGLDGTLLVDTG